MTDKQKIEMIKDVVTVTNNYLGDVVTVDNHAGYIAVLELMTEFITQICNK